MLLPIPVNNNRRERQHEISGWLKAHVGEQYLDWDWWYIGTPNILYVWIDDSKHEVAVQAAIMWTECIDNTITNLQQIGTNIIYKPAEYS